MDHEDAILINNQIEILKLNNHNLITQSNEQIKINTEMIERFQNITENIKNQRLVTKNFLNTVSNKLYNVSTAISFTQQLNAISLNIDNFQNHLDILLQSINLSRLNIIPKILLNQEESNYIFEILLKQKIGVKSLEQIYEYCTLIAYYNHTNIVFSINIPIFDPQIFDHTLIEPLPTTELKTLKIPFPFAITSPDKTYFIQQPCDTIHDIKICMGHALIDYSDDKCFHNVLHGLPAICNFQQYLNKTEIKPLWPTYLIIKNAATIELHSNCGLKQQLLQGTMLIHYQNCTIEIENVKFENWEITKNSPVYVLPLLNTNINQTSLEKTIDINQLDDFTIHNRNRIEEIEFKETIHTSAVYTIIGIILIGLIIIICINNRTTPAVINHTIDTVNKRTTNLDNDFVNFMMTPRVHSEEGGVTY